MIVRRRNIVHALAVILLLLSAACSPATPKEPAAPPASVLTPEVTVQLTPFDTTVNESKTSDSTGRAVFEDDIVEVKIPVQVEDRQSNTPVSEVKIHLSSNGSRFLIVVIDERGLYLPSVVEGSYEEQRSMSRSHPSLFSVPRAFAAPLEQWEELRTVLILLERLEQIASLKELTSFLTNLPNLERWTLWYTESCWTGEQLASAVGALGLLLPSASAIVGWEPLIAAAVAMSLHTITEDAQAWLQNHPGPHRIRILRLPIPIPAIQYLGPCAPRPTSTPARRPSTATLPPPTSTPLAAPTPLPPGVVARGKIAFVSNRDGNFEVYVMNADGTGVTNLTNNPADDFDPAWSPDSRHITFVSDREGNYEVYVMNADGMGVTNLTNNPADDEDPSWSPDGGRIMFVSDRDCSEKQVYVMNADGTGVTRLSTVCRVDHQNPTWSPDGRRILLQRDGDICIANADGTGLTYPLENTGLRIPDKPAWSPDSQRIVFEASAPAPADLLDAGIYVINVDGTDLTRLTSTPRRMVANDPTWSPDGRHIAFAFCPEDDWNSEIYVMNADGTGVTRLTNDPATEGHPMWSPK